MPNPRAFLARAAAAAALALAVSAAPGLRAQDVVDCLAAEVDGAPITRLDVIAAERLGLYPASDGAAAADPDARRRAALDALVDQAVVLELAKGQVAVGDDEIDAAFGALRSRVGAAPLAAILAEWGFEEGDVRALLRDRLLFDKVVAMRFSQPPAVSLSEIEAFYRDTYAPEAARAGRVAEPIVQVVDRIETRLREAKRRAQSAAWVRSLRAQADVRIRADCLR